MFIKLPIEIYYPNKQLEDLRINYEKDYHKSLLKVNTNHIQMYKGDGETTSMWMVGSDQAYVVELTEKEFEKRIGI